MDTVLIKVAEFKELKANAYARVSVINIDSSIGGCQSMGLVIVLLIFL